MRPPVVLAVVALALSGGACGSAGAHPPPSEPAAPATAAPAPPATTAAPAGRSPATATPARPSRAVGAPWGGRLVRGVQLAESGPDWVTWDPIRKRTPNRPWRRWGTDALVETIQRVLAEYRAAHPGVPPVLIADLSRPRGGVFDRRFGGRGHASHQNGLDADVMYPRLDRRLRSAWRPDQVDRALAQDLVDRFVAAGAQFVFVGPRLGLRGPPKVVQALRHHDDHMHVRIRPPRP